MGCIIIKKILYTYMLRYSEIKDMMINQIIITMVGV